jgi:hypothetical protein
MGGIELAKLGGIAHGRDYVWEGLRLERIALGRNRAWEGSRMGGITFKQNGAWEGSRMGGIAFRRDHAYQHPLPHPHPHLHTYPYINHNTHSPHSHHPRPQRPHAPRHPHIPLMYTYTFLQALLLLLAPPMAAAPSQYCPLGASTAYAKDLVRGGVTAAYRLADVQSTLCPTGAFATADIFGALLASDGGSGTLSAAQLEAYDSDAVPAFSNGNLTDGALRGDRLAAYQGGGVLVTACTDTAGTPGGRWLYAVVSNSCTLMDYASPSIPPHECAGGGGGGAEPPARERGLPHGIILHQERATRHGGRGTGARGCALGKLEVDWLALCKTKGTQTLVEIHMIPVSSQESGILCSRDGGALRNGQLVCSKCMTCGIGTYAGAGEQGWGDGDGGMGGGESRMGIEGAVWKEWVMHG